MYSYTSMYPRTPPVALEPTGMQPLKPISIARLHQAVAREPPCQSHSLIPLPGLALDCGSTSWAFRVAALRVHPHRLHVLVCVSCVVGRNNSRAVRASACPACLCWPKITSAGGSVSFETTDYCNSAKRNLDGAYFCIGRTLSPTLSPSTEYYCAVLFLLAASNASYSPPAYIQDTPVLTNLLIAISDPKGPMETNMQTGLTTSIYFAQQVRTDRSV
ncbi:hypothetical protein J3F84DRAFT_220983 [Trichoderma pleuroticola]